MFLRLRYTVALFVVLVFVTSPSPCFSQKTVPAAGRSLETVTLQLKWKHQFQFAGYYAALEKGFYRQAGLDVTIVAAIEGEESTDRVISGAADFGIAMSDLVSLRAKGRPVVALASIYQHSPLILLAPNTSGIENIHGLKGKRVALEAHAEELLAYFESEGVPASKMVIFPHEYDISTLIAGHVDAISAYSTDEPFMLLKQGIKYSTFSPRAGGIDFYGDTLFTTENMVREKPERVSAFLEASLNGWKYALENTDEIIDLILTKYTQRHSREHLIFEARMSKSLIMANVVELGYMNQGRWLNIANTLKMLNKIPDDFSLEGFIYERNPAPDFRWLYISLAVAIVIALLAFLISGRFYKLNRALNVEISQRIEIENSLKNSERKISNLLSNLPGIAYRSLNDDTYTMQFVSQGCYKLTGYEPSDLIANKTVSYLDLIHPEDREMVNQEVKSALYENRPFKLFYRITDRQGHLKWVWEQGRGIYSEDGEIELIDGLIADITKQRKIEKEREDLIAQLQAALKEIKTLSGMLPICAACKKIRDDKGYWNQIESYIQKHSEAEFSHGMCPDCLDKLYGDQDWYQKRDRK